MSLGPAIINNPHIISEATYQYVSCTALYMPAIFTMLLYSLRRPTLENRAAAATGVDGPKLISHIPACNLTRRTQ